jgi:hypothetical protein
MKKQGKVILLNLFALKLEMIEKTQNLKTEFYLLRGKIILKNDLLVA